MYRAARMTSFSRENRRQPPERRPCCGREGSFRMCLTAVCVSYSVSYVKITNTIKLCFHPTRKQLFDQTVTSTFTCQFEGVFGVMYCNAPLQFSSQVIRVLIKNVWLYADKRRKMITFFLSLHSLAHNFFTTPLLYDQEFINLKENKSLKTYNLFSSQGFRDL